jgi:hypothetical protein
MPPGQASSMMRRTVVDSRTLVEARRMSSLLNNRHMICFGTEEREQASLIGLARSIHEGGCWRSGIAAIRAFGLTER